MKFVLNFTLFCSVICTSITCTNLRPSEWHSSVEDPDLNRDAVSLIKSRGFGVEIHRVTTKDGYILTLHRLKNPNYKGKVRPVLLQHGLLSSGVDFIINSPGGGINSSVTRDACQIRSPTSKVGNNLGFVLSRHGFDVWLGNSRGNEYSRNHTKLDPKSNEFWQFTFDQMIDFDLPAVIKHILNVTKQETLAYVGHSQGSLQMFGLLSTQPSYADKIKPFIALGPVASLFKVKSPIKYAEDFPLLSKYMKKEGGPFFISDRFAHFVGRHFCQSLVPSLCEDTLFVLFGFDSYQMNKTRLGVYLNHIPSSTSNWNVLHFMQMLKSKILTRFDYGKEENLFIYGQATPPIYSVANITSKYIVLMYGDNDWLADPTDVQFLKKSLKVKLFEDYRVPFKKWNHMDFMWAKEAGIYVNNKIIDVLRRTINCETDS